jgi:hypothetical protein
MPPTVADLDDEVTDNCGLVLHDAGLFLRALDSDNPPNKITPVVRRGLMKGYLAVGATPASPLILADSDLTGLSAFAIKRVLDVAEMYSFQRCLAGWYRVTREHQEPLSVNPMAGGWLLEERTAVKDRVRDLKIICDVPYREPTDPAVVGHRDWVHPSDEPIWPYGFYDGWEGGWFP